MLSPLVVPVWFPHCHFYEMAGSLLTTFGDDPEAARASLERGRRRMERGTKSFAKGSYRPRSQRLG